MLFNENAANSSLRRGLGVAVLDLEPADQADVSNIVAVQSQSLPTAVRPGMNYACRE
jgi:hypothetical protein